VSIPRRSVASLVFLRAEIPENHPSAAVLGEERMGAGVVVDAGRILTAHYLVLGAEQVEVTALDGRINATTAIKLDHESGLALLTLARSDLEPIALSETEASPGMPVFLLSCTGEQERCGATGHVSSVEPFEAFWEYMLDEAIMTTAINPGLAGGPLLDRHGRLLGIVTLGLAAVGRYSLAIPSQVFSRRRGLLESQEPMPAEERRAWLGYYVQAHEETVTLTGIVAGGPADQAGLQRGDVVLSVDGDPVTTLRELYNTVWRKTPGQPVGMQILRDEAIQVIEVVAGDRYDFYD
jgi:S1-C subfamily serine protease